MADALPVTFIAGKTGPWQIERITTVSGAGLLAAERLLVHEGADYTAPTVSPTEATSSPDWVLRGAVSNQRYTTAAELTRLNAQSPALGRPDATVASLIPITKSNEWWELAQDERRAIFEETSHHIRRSMDYLPAVARRLHHCRDLGGPFDFLTWFEFAPINAAAFDDLLAELRGTTEWTFVEREVEVRVTRGPR
ncbi:chlorite dismutase family protein [Cryobacterium sp. TMT1-66-1]|uniref:chlorite dismutase family protein n=1 Tax=Cryobacterium sp. TMT1-66-1 TaxID=1259242 RepID=UPI00106C66C0|nr:chlorite dismutase family protein [Cryobacterium sp. TMT1-66-1]TFD06602.1 chlorite dismutase [Cryobacterium sp. TMT1-66-1]